MTDESSPRPPFDLTSTPGWAEAHAKRREIYALRGEVISVVSELEGAVDRILTIYFVPPGKDAPHRSSDFGLWILPRLSLAEKIDILSSLAKRLGISEYTNPLLQELRFANAFRADQAHSHVGLNDDGVHKEEIVWSELLQWTVTRKSKAGIRTSPADEAELREALTRMNVLGPKMTICFLEALANPDDPVAAVKEGIRSNSDLMSGSYVPGEVPYLRMTSKVVDLFPNKFPDDE